MFSAKLSYVLKDDETYCVCYQLNADADAERIARLLNDDDAAMNRLPHPAVQLVPSSESGSMILGWQAD